MVRKERPEQKKRADAGATGNAAQNSPFRLSTQLPIEYRQQRGGHRAALSHALSGAIQGRNNTELMSVPAAACPHAAPLNSQMDSLLQDLHDSHTAKDRSVRPPVALPVCYSSAAGQAQNPAGSGWNKINYGPETAYSMSSFKKTITTVFWVGEDATRKTAISITMGAIGTRNG